MALGSTVNVAATITTSNTFDHWRIRDNLVADDVNEIVRGDFIKPKGNVYISEGRLELSNSIGGVILDVTDDTNIDGTLTVFNVELDNSTNHLYVDAGDIHFRRMQSGDRFKVNTNTVFYSSNTEFTNVTHGTINVNNRMVTINSGIVNIANTDGAATLNVHPNTYIFGVLNVTNNVYAYNLNVASNTSTGNLIVRDLANIETANIITAYVRTLSVTDPILSPAVNDSDLYVLRFSTSTRPENASGGDGYFRVRRGQDPGTANADLHWNESSGNWQILFNNAPANVVMGNITANFKATRDYISSSTVSGAVSVDVSTSNWFKYTLNGSTTFTFVNAPSNGLAITFTLVVIQDGSGSRNYSFANTVYWAGGQIPPTTTGPSSKDLWTFTSYDGGVTYVGTLAVKDFR